VSLQTIGRILIVETDPCSSSVPGRGLSGRRKLFFLEDILQLRPRVVCPAMDVGEELERACIDCLKLDVPLFLPGSLLVTAVRVVVVPRASPHHSSDRCPHVSWSLLFAVCGVVDRNPGESAHLVVNSCSYSVSHTFPSKRGTIDATPSQSKSSWTDPDTARLDPQSRSPLSTSGRMALERSSTSTQSLKTPTHPISGASTCTMSTPTHMCPQRCTHLSRASYISSEITQCQHSV